MTSASSFFSLSNSLSQVGLGEARAGGGGVGVRPAGDGYSSLSEEGLSVHVRKGFRAKGGTGVSESSDSVSFDETSDEEGDGDQNSSVTSDPWADMGLTS